MTDVKRAVRRHRTAGAARRAAPSVVTPHGSCSSATASGRRRSPASRARRVSPESSTRRSAPSRPRQGVFDVALAATTSRCPVAERPAMWPIRDEPDVRRKSRCSSPDSCSVSRARPGPDPDPRRPARRRLARTVCDAASGGLTGMACSHGTCSRPASCATTSSSTSSRPALELPAIDHYNGCAATVDCRPLRDLAGQRHLRAILGYPTRPEQRQDQRDGSPSPSSTSRRRCRPAIDSGPASRLSTRPLQPPSGSP